MADSSRTIMTDAGFALETRVRADETKMQFTRAAISTDDHFSDTDDALAKLTELYNIQQDGKVTAVQVINTTTVYVQVDVNQAESKADYQMRSAALYAKDDDGTEVLYGVTVLQDPVFVHKDADGSYLGFGINTTVGRASNVVVVVDPANMVTQQVFEGTMKNYYTKAEVDAKFVTDDDFASKLPKNIATTDAANTFAKSQTLAGGATDGKGNAYATTKDVATGLNNGLSTKVTDNKNGTITANNSTYDLSKTGITPLGVVSSGSFNDLPLGTVFTDPPMTDGPDTIHSFTTTTFLSSEWGGRKAQIAITDNTNLMYFRIGTDTSWKNWVLLSDDSKVVHSTDMRKPANDVAGIEEVNAKQDKIGYTPADDSKVVHNSGNEEIGGQKTFDIAPIDKTTGNPYITKSDLNNGLSTKVTDNKNGTEQLNGVQVQPFNKLSDSVGGRNLLPISNYASGYVNGADGSVAPMDNTNKEAISDFVPVDITQSYYCQIIQQVNNNMTWNAIGFYDNNKQFISRLPNGYAIVTGTITSVIRMLPLGFPNISIPNVYTVVFPTNTAYVRISFRTYGNPIQASLEKSSVLSDWTPAPEDKVNVSDMRKPASDVAGIDEVNAKQDKIGYTPANAANVVARNPDTGVVSEPTDFTNLTVNGGKSVATRDDLKSLEASAWRPLKLVSSTSGTILFKDNGDGTASLTGSAIFNVAPDKDNFIAKVDAPDGYVFTSVDWKINIDSSTQIIGINSQYAISETGSNWHALKVKIQDGNLLIGGSNNWNENNLITFNVSTTNLKTVSLAGSPATIGITKLN